MILKGELFFEAIKRNEKYVDKQVSGIKGDPDASLEERKTVYDNEQCPLM